MIENVFFLFVTLCKTEISHSLRLNNGAIGHLLFLAEIFDLITDYWFFDSIKDDKEFRDVAIISIVGIKVNFLRFFYVCLRLTSTTKSFFGTHKNKGSYCHHI